MGDLGMLNLTNIPTDRQDLAQNRGHRYSEGCSHRIQTRQQRRGDAEKGFISRFPDWKSSSEPKVGDESRSLRQPAAKIRIVELLTIHQSSNQTSIQPFHQLEHLT